MTSLKECEDWASLLSSVSVYGNEGRRGRRERGKGKGKEGEKSFSHGILSNCEAPSSLLIKLIHNTSCCVYYFKRSKMLLYAFRLIFSNTICRRQCYTAETACRGRFHSKLRFHPLLTQFSWLSFYFPLISFVSFLIKIKWSLIQ